jgi:hypothetical protein
MVKVYIKIKNTVFECLPEQTQVDLKREYDRGCPIAERYSFTAAIITPQPWPCKVQKMWNKLPKKPRSVQIVMVDEDGATELLFENVEITYISNIDDTMFTEEMTCRSLIPVLKGMTGTPTATVNHEKPWWEL